MFLKATKNTKMILSPSVIMLAVLLMFILEATIIGRSFTALEFGMLDAKLFAYMGDMISDGMRLYVDIWDNKPPGIFWVSVLTTSLSLDQFVSLALLEAVMVLATIFSVFLVLKALHIDRFSLVFTIITSAIVFNLSFYNEGGNLTELYLLLPMTLSIWCFIVAEQKDSKRLYVLAGVMTGVAVLFKLPGLSPFLAQLVFVVVMVWQQKLTISKTFGIVLLLIIGISIPWLAVIAYFALVGGLPELLNISFIYPFTYGVASQKNVIQIVIRLIEMLQPVYGLIPLALMAIFISIKTIFTKQVNSIESLVKASDGSQFYLLIALWLAADLSGCLAGGRFYPHYFLAMLPSLSIAAGIGLHCLFRSDSMLGKIKYSGKIIIVILIVFPLTYYHFTDIISIAKKVIKPHDNQPNQTLLINHINRMQHQDDLLFVWDYIPDIYFQTKLKPASRYLTSVNLWDSAESANLVGERIITDLQTNKPRFVVTTNQVFLDNAPLQPISKYFSDWLSLNYKLDFAADDLQLYIRK